MSRIAPPRRMVQATDLLAVEGPAVVEKVSDIQVMSEDGPCIALW